MTMDPQFLLNIILVGGMGVVGWYVRGQDAKIVKVQDELAAERAARAAALEKMPDTYTRRDDFRDVTSRIDSRFDTLETLVRQLIISQQGK